ncbi:MAG: hypothetical protein D4R88_08110 [Methanosarcinales archaeon]|nr:MAG: hypothetical protein D4R88_08110 [Methanosarcinales archaeon]
MWKRTILLWLMALLITVPCEADVLDEVGGAIAAYSVRKLSTSYSGPAIKVRRASDNSTLDIGFDGNGDLDTSSLGTFCAGTDCYVTTWYDQVSSMDMSQATAASQPQIVSNGTILTDTNGKPRLYFTADNLSGSGISINNKNLTAFFMQQTDYVGELNYLLYLGTNNRTLTWWLNRINNQSGTIGNGTAVVCFGDTSKTPMAAIRTIQILDSGDNEINLYRNRINTKTITHTYDSNSVSLLKIGTYTGYMQEVIFYQHLSESNRITVYENIDTYYETAGPQNVNSNALLPQDWQYQVDLYDWLETITTSNVNTTPGSLSWDESYTNMDALANLWLQLYGGRVEHGQTLDIHKIIRAEDKWFVLNDGSSAGIEGSGSVKVFRFPSSAAFWYTANFSGNPYYQDPGVGMRGLISIAVDMMMHDKLQDGSPGYWSNVDFAGGSMLGWMWAYEEFKDLISPSVQAAFEDGFAYMAWKMLQWGAHDVNGNMDTKAIAALAHTYTILSDPTEKQWCVDAAKKILFGSTTGTPDTTDYVNGLYRRAGYIDEGDSPETTYNGVSLFYLTEAYATTRGESDWSFLETVVESMAKFKVYQYFPDPDNYWDGPSGYAGRTGGSYVMDQRTKLWRDLTVADAVTVARPLITERVFNQNQIKTEAEMVAGINSAITYYNNQSIGNLSTAAPSNWSENHWPTDNIYYPASGWWNNLKSLVDADDSTLLYPYENPQAFNIDFDDEFWAYKGNDGNRDFGFFIETLADPGQYSGWYGGSLQAFWTRDTGILFLARHDKSGGEVHKVENTRVWSKIDSWGTHHIWGKDENGNAFSTAATNNLDHRVEYSTEGADVTSVEVQTVLSSASSKGQETGSELQGTVTFTNLFTTIADRGLQITHSITSRGTDQIRELWAVLPVFLRDTDQSIADTTIEYWDGSAWQAMGTSLISTQKIRLGRDFGSGLKYGHVLFEQMRKVKLSDSVWVQSYQGNSRLRNIKIDLHGNPGRNISFPTSITLTMRIQTSEMVD